MSGLRKEEGITSFNLIIDLSKQGGLNGYLNENGVLEHFRFKEKFLRVTKNAYVSIVPMDLISEIGRTQKVTYAGIVKRIHRREMRCRINELRDYYGTFMVRPLIREEVDLQQGRVGKSIFARFYWSPSFKELQSRVLKAIHEMDGGA